MKEQSFLKPFLVINAFSRKCATRAPSVTNAEVVTTGSYLELDRPGLNS